MKRLEKMSKAELLEEWERLSGSNEIVPVLCSHKYRLIETHRFYWHKTANEQWVTITDRFYCEKCLDVKEVNTDKRVDSRLREYPKGSEPK